MAVNLAGCRLGGQYVEAPSVRRRGAVQGDAGDAGFGREIAFSFMPIRRA